MSIGDVEGTRGMQLAHISWGIQELHLKRASVPTVRRLRRRQACAQNRVAFSEERRAETGRQREVVLHVRLAWDGVVIVL